MSLETGEKVIDSTAIDGMLTGLAEEICKMHKPAMDEVALVGIRTGGAFLAERLKGKLESMCGKAPDTGVIDITLYRDDWTRAHNRPQVGKTEISFPVEARTVILVDDVLYTGRTVRAAMDALIDFGRPGRIELAVLIDRGGRELPIQPDYVGEVMNVGRSEVIDVLTKEGGAGEDMVIKKSSSR